MNLIDELLGLIDALLVDGLEYAFCGGIALAIHGHPRFTNAIDLLVEPADLERARTIGKRLGLGIAGSQTLTLDLLPVGPALADVWRDRRRSEWRGRPLWVVSREGLVRMKRLSGRMQDLADIEALERFEEERSHG